VSLRRRCRSAAELEQSLLAQQPQRTQHGIGVGTEHGGVAVFTLFERTAQSQSASPALHRAIECSRCDGDPRIAFISEPPRVGRQGDGGLYVVNVDGSASSS
jgi:hypothetical protein